MIHLRGAALRRAPPRSLANRRLAGSDRRRRRARDASREAARSERRRALLVNADAAGERGALAGLADRGVERGASAAVFAAQELVGEELVALPLATYSDGGGAR